MPTLEFRSLFLSLAASSSSSARASFFLSSLLSVLLASLLRLALVDLPSPGATSFSWPEDFFLAAEASAVATGVPLDTEPDFLAR
jgi:hypothetical protein